MLSKSGYIYFCLLIYWTPNSLYCSKLFLSQRKNKTYNLLFSLFSFHFVTFSPFIPTLGYKGIKPVINNFFIASTIVIAMYSLEVLRIKDCFPPPGPHI